LPFVEPPQLGVIKSPMHPVETHPELDALHPVGHMGEISDVVDAILYLESASFVTGEILHVDGGQSAVPLTPPRGRGWSALAPGRSAGRAIVTREATKTGALPQRRGEGGAHQGPESFSWSTERFQTPFSWAR
jgi:hypothetical protein